MLFRDTVAVYCENPTKQINTLCGKNAEFEHIAFSEAKSGSDS
jgi:hypothetical protein